MSKEEFMKIQTCVLKVNIHCDGCKNKVKKIMQKIDGVFKTTIDAEQGKVTVLGNVDHNVLIKKLQKAGKHAELWGAQKPNNINQNQLTNQFKNMQLDNGKGGNNNGNNKGQKGGNNNPPKGGGGGGGGQPNQQQAQQMKGIQDLKLHPFKDMKMPMDQNQKGVKFILPEDEDLSDYDDDEFDEDEFDDEYDDEFDEPLPAMKMPVMGNGLQGIPNNILEMMSRNNPQLMNAQKLPQNGAAQNGKKGGGPVQVNIGNGESKNGNGSKKGGAGGGGGNNGGNNQNPGGKHGKNGGVFPQNGNNGGGANGKNGNNGGGGNSNNMNGNGGKKGNGGGGGGGGGGGMGGMSDGFRNMGGAVPPAMMANAKMGQMGNMPMGQMGNMPIGQMGNMPIGQMGNPPAVQGLPAPTMGGGASAGGSGGYFQGAGPDLMPGNPYHQQPQYIAALMNQQQRAMGNERFQPMMYARPPPAVNFVPQQPYPPQQPYSPYPYPYPSHDPSYTHFFSDENTSSCTVM